MKGLSSRYAFCMGFVLGTCTLYVLLQQLFDPRISPQLPRGVENPDTPVVVGRENPST
ncbi:glycoprotein-N-acetylgalactosamine 3-beta-galactosyltransferase 1-B-like, partial [Arapaima gigas]